MDVGHIYNIYIRYSVLGGFNEQHLIKICQSSVKSGNLFTRWDKVDARFMLYPVGCGFLSTLNVEWYTVYIYIYMHMYCIYIYKYVFIDLFVYLSVYTFAVCIYIYIYIFIYLCKRVMRKAVFSCWNLNSAMTRRGSYGVRVGHLRSHQTWRARKSASYQL